MKKYILPILMFILFETIAVVLWRTLGKIFYFYNFTYIGFFVSLGIALLIAQYKNARIFIQFCVGLYMLVFLGLIKHENMQIEGFFYYICIGVFEAAAIHYLVAKIGGPVIFGRGWCGYACWTAMVLDLLPYKKPEKPRIKKLGLLRIFIFAISLSYFCIIYVFYRETVESVLFISFIAGNIIYYCVGIIFAFLFRDNRAFCKYLKARQLFCLVAGKSEERKMYFLL